MEWSIITDCLLDNKRVSNILLDSSDIYNSISYLCVIHCSLLVDRMWVPVVICIPEDWRLKIIDIYIEDYSTLPFIPHCEINGKLCLYDLEGALIDWNICGIIQNCIDRAISVIGDGLVGRNQIDFLLEFGSYWGQLKKTRKAYFDVPISKKTKKIKYATITGNKTYGAVYASADENFFNYRRVTEPQRNGLYLYYESGEDIFPPDPRKELSLDYVNRVLSSISIEKKRKLIEKKSPICCLIFEVKNACSLTALWGVMIKNGEFKEISKNHFIISHADTIYPLDIIRLDKKYLMGRTSTIENIMQTKKYLLIGCGSIGGHIAQELVKAGCEDITLVDDDILEEENIFRHVLGSQYTFHSKVVALKQSLEHNIPNLSIKVRERRIEEALEDGSVDLSEYDIVISAVGNHNVNRMLNKYIIDHQIMVPTFYLWNEPLDIGCHAMRVKFKDKGCYECIFCRDVNNFEIYDGYSYCEKGQNFAQSFNGCSNTFIPYGSTVSLKVAAIGMDLIRKEIEGRCTENVLVSFKGEGYHFRRAGFICSAIYDGQENAIEYVRGSCFCNECCDICG